MGIPLRVNGRCVEVDPGLTLGGVARSFKAGSDLMIRNGFPAAPGTPVEPGDEVVLIRRGEIPPAEELEAQLVARHTPGVHARVREGRVGIAGVGGLGSQVATALARTGVGTIVFADFDVVEPSNLNRQQYFVDQLGMPKVEALAQTLRRINPYVDLRPVETTLTTSNITEIFGTCQVIVEAFDRADQKAMLVEAVLTSLPETWVIAASGLAGYGPSDTIATHRLGPRLFVIGDLSTEARPGVGLMAPRVGVAAHAQANQVLRILLGEEAASRGGPRVAQT